MEQNLTPYQRLRELLLIHGVDRVAEMAGCSYQTVYRVTRGNPPTWLRTATGLSELVDCDVEDWSDERALDYEERRRREIEQRRSESREQRRTA